MSSIEPEPRPDESETPPTPPPAWPPPGTPVPRGLPPAPPLSESLPPETRRNIKPALLGGAVGLAVYAALAVLGALNAGTGNGEMVLFGMFFGIIAITIILVIAGVVLVAFGRTRTFAIGLLIAIAVGIFVDGGVCIALASAANPA